MRCQVLAMGQDQYWLRAVEAGADEQTEVHTVPGEEGLINCLRQLPPVSPDTLLLIDATGQADIRRVVRRLRADGWKRVIILAADPSFREAHAVLQEASGYDYLPKSYDPGAIRRLLSLAGPGQGGSDGQ